MTEQRNAAKPLGGSPTRFVVLVIALAVQLVLTLVTNGRLAGQRWLQGMAAALLPVLVMLS